VDVKSFLVSAHFRFRFRFRFRLVVNGFNFLLSPTLFEKWINFQRKPRLSIWRCQIRAVAPLAPLMSFGTFLYAYSDASSYAYFKGRIQRKPWFPLRIDPLFSFVLN